MQTRKTRNLFVAYVCICSPTSCKKRLRSEPISAHQVRDVQGNATTCGNLPVHPDEPCCSSWENGVGKGPERGLIEFKIRQTN